jgi:hypothetical protein
MGRYFGEIGACSRRGAGVEARMAPVARAPTVVIRGGVGGRGRIGLDQPAGAIESLGHMSVETLIPPKL